MNRNDTKPRYSRSPCYRKVNIDNTLVKTLFTHPATGKSTLITHLQNTLVTFTLLYMKVSIDNTLVKHVMHVHPATYRKVSIENILVT